MSNEVSLIQGIQLTREHSQEAVITEVNEEIGLEIKNPRLLGIIENVFVPKHTGVGLGHNIEFIYEVL